MIVEKLVDQFVRHFVTKFGKVGHLASGALAPYGMGWSRLRCVFVVVVVVVVIATVVLILLSLLH